MYTIGTAKSYEDALIFIKEEIENIRLGPRKQILNIVGILQDLDEALKNTEPILKENEN